MYRYVGTAKNRPDSLTPRRFMIVMNATTPRQIATRALWAPWNCGIEMIAATPADTETATVRM